MVADIAIELEGMRLATYRAASLRRPGQATFAREAAIARQLCARRRACRSAPTACSCSAATATSRSTRSSAGTATCARPASWKERCSSDERSTSRFPRSSSRSSTQAHQVAERGLPPDLAQVRPRRARVPEGARHARGADRRHERGRRASSGAGAAGVRQPGEATATAATATAPTCPPCLAIMELCWGDVGLLLSMPRQGLGNSAIAAVADDEQLERFDGKWAAMAITEPEAGSDSAAIRTTARARRRRVRAQRREDLRHRRRARRPRRRLGDARPRAWAARRSSRSWSSAPTRA